MEGRIMIDTILRLAIAFAIGLLLSLNEIQF
jgi:hypothetical protein